MTQNQMRKAIQNNPEFNLRVDDVMVTVLRRTLIPILSPDHSVEHVEKMIHEGLRRAHRYQEGG